MGLNERQNITYLSVSYGAIRKKVDETTPKAKKRETKNGDIWELVYNDITGRLVDIRYSDDEYGKKWKLIIQDGDDTFSVQVQEDSRYGTDLMKKMPYLHKGAIYNFKPFDFEDDKERVVCGISIKDEFGNKITSFYHESVEGQERATLLHGFPPYDESLNKDKDEQKMYFIKLAKFLRSNCFAHIKGGFLQPAPPPPPTSKKPDVEAGLSEKDDLPF